MGDEDGLKCWHSHRKWKQQLVRWTQIADLQKCVTKKSLWTKKLRCLCPQIEYFGISVPFCYYSLLGRVIDFPSRVRVVKNIPGTGRVASTCHSLLGRPKGWVAKVDGKRCSLRLGITKDRAMLMWREEATNAKSMRKGGTQSIMERLRLSGWISSN